MSLLNDMLGQVSQTATVQNLAAKVGITPEEAASAIAALGNAHSQPGDTVQTASDATGLPTDTLNAIVGHIGGEGALGQFASILQAEGGLSGALGGCPSFSS
jgi:hypothetical protein